MPLKACDIDALVVWYSLGTEIPYPSSQIKTAIGICKTPAAFIASQKWPSDVDASPLVTKQTSLPLLERVVNFFSCSILRKLFDANARPKPRGICPDVGAISAEMFFRFARSSHSPFSSKNGSEKWAFICLPALKGS